MVHNLVISPFVVEDEGLCKEGAFLVLELSIQLKHQLAGDDTLVLEHLCGLAQ